MRRTMLKIRMQRIGRKNDPAFRLVVAEHTTAPKSGKCVERVGSYHPKTKERTIDAERVKYWISVGAQPSDTVHNMLVTEGIVDGPKRNVLPQKSPVVKEQPEAATEEAPATEDAAAEASPEEPTSGEETPAQEEAAPATEETPAADTEETNEEEKKDKAPAVDEAAEDETKS